MLFHITECRNANLCDRCRLISLHSLLGISGSLGTLTHCEISAGTQTVSNIVENEMRLLGPDGGKFVSFEKDGDGQISAIVTDTARVNILSAELLNAIVEASDRGDLDLSIPFGNLLGVSFFLGRGPAVPIKITMLTSSRVDFRNVLTDAGINQTKHQLLLEVCVDADVLLPWEIRSTQIVTEVLIAETIIVGRVPQTYFYTGET